MKRQVSKNNITFNVIGNYEHWTSFENNTWEEQTFNVLNQLLRAEDIMIDIGAWIGPISLYAAKKTKRCYSFEPDPVAFEQFITNLQLNPDLSEKIIPHNAAISVDGKNVKLFSRSNHGDSGSSLLKRVKSQNEFVEVKSVKLDEFVSVSAIEKIDFVKMDIEGGEFFVLPDILPLLKKDKPNLLISFHPAALAEYYEMNLLPLGILRRIYRLFDPEKKILKRKVQGRISDLLKSLAFYSIYDADLNVYDIDKKSNEFMNIDMLVFSVRI